MTSSIILFSFLVFSCAEENTKNTPDNTKEKLAITSLIPNTGYEGQKVTIEGTHLESAGFYFGAVRASVISAEANESKVIVPSSSTIGKVQVTAQVGSEISNSSSFTYTEIPEEEKEKEKEPYDDGAGHLIYGNASTLPLLKHTGPYIRLADGSIFTAHGGAICEISKNEGVGWTQYQMFDPGKFSLASPVSVQSHTGAIFVGFSNSKEKSEGNLNWNKTTHCYDSSATLPTYIVVSRDNGKTWSIPVKLHDEWTGMNRAFIETNDGHLVFSTMIMRNNPGRHCVLTYVSADDGVTWKASNVLDNPTSAGDHSGLTEAALTELKDGRLWLLIRTNWDYFYESFSSDHGLTWDGYKKTPIDASASPGDLQRLQSGRIVLVWNRLYHEGETSIDRLGGDNNLSEVAASWQRNELSVMYTDDEGKTWSNPIIVAKNAVRGLSGQSAKWIAYPHAFEVSPGNVWITSDYGGVKILLKEKDM
ncbi:MAG: exo-alpha-sialidase [Mangrovibacterium sp.]